MNAGKDLINRWGQAAPFWDKHRDTIRAMYAPITRALIEATQIAPGQSVLDVATGPGEPALSIAQVVGPSGQVVGIDPATAMIAGAERAARANQLQNARFEVATADSLPLSEDSFDAVVSRFGVMFFPSPIDGVREMLRVLKPNRRIAFAVWGYPERNPYHYAVADILERYVPEEPVPPDSPDAFRFAAPGKLLNILNAAGAIQTTERLLQFDIKAQLSAEDFWALRSEMSDKLRTSLAGVPEEQRMAIRRDVIQNLRAYSTAEGMCFPAQVLIVSGTKYNDQAHEHPHS
jgi:ubiquinone/menaquinone biosynthesis C-methylase UbiE